MLWFNANSISSIDSNVDELPTPAIKGNVVSLEQNENISFRSSFYKVADSPVVPTSTSPSVPDSSWNKSKFLNESKSTSPFDFIGVTIAAILPFKIFFPII